MQLIKVNTISPNLLIKVNKWSSIYKNIRSVSRNKNKNVKDCSCHGYIKHIFSDDVLVFIDK